MSVALSLHLQVLSWWAGLAALAPLIAVRGIRAISARLKRTLMMLTGARWRD